MLPHLQQEDSSQIYFLWSSCISSESRCSHFDDADDAGRHHRRIGVDERTFLSVSLHFITLFISTLPAPPPLGDFALLRAFFALDPVSSSRAAAGRDSEQPKSALLGCSFYLGQSE